MESIEVNKKVEEIKKDSIIHVECSWGLDSCGSAGYLITKDGELYSYQSFVYVPEGMEEGMTDDFRKEKVVSEKFKEEIQDYFEKNIKGKYFPYVMICDASYIVTINNVSIHNCVEIYDDVIKIIKNEINRA